jgi:hypothetical protein
LNETDPCRVERNRPRKRIAGVYLTQASANFATYLYANRKNKTEIEGQYHFGAYHHARDRMIEERALATVTDYDEMIGALRARMAELRVTNETIGAIAGLAGGYVGKLLAPSRIKNLGPTSLGLMLQSLGLKLIVVEDTKTTAKMRPRWTQREKALPLLAMVRTPPRATWLFTPRSGRKAAKARAEKLSPAERSAIGLHAINTRWQREREKETRQRLARQARTA